MAISDKITGMSRRVRRVEPPKPDPSPFAQVGGWADASDPSGDAPLGDILTERAARVAGANALARLYRDRAKEPPRQVVPEHLRGTDFSKPWGE